MTPERDDVAEVRKPSRGTGKLLAATLASIVLSIGGIALAIIRGVPADGGRGGAIAVALTFFMLFMGRSTAETVLVAEIPVAPPNAKPDRDAVISGEIVRVRNAVASLLDWQNTEKVYLMISSVCGTLVWGFGDVIAASLCGAVRH